jgi:Ca2+-binding RTX toxin-like protein
LALYAFTDETSDGAYNFSQQSMSPVSSPDRITDFNAGEGDLLRSGITNGLGGGSIPLVWRGTAAAGFTAALGQSMAAAGSDPTDTRFLELWTYFDAANNRTVLFMDRNRDFTVDGNDFMLWFDGNLVSNANAALNLGPASFTTGTFAVKVGTAGDDTNTNPVLTTGADLAFGLGGNDSLVGLEGNDTLNGDAGNDTLAGGLGTDVLYGGTGNDVLNGDAGIDMLYGSSGSDTLSGGDDTDYLYAAGPRDSTTGNSDADAAGTLNVLLGGAGNDYLNGGAGNDSLDGGADNDNLRGGDGADTLLGGDGNDALYGDVGSDSLEGGSGNDTLWAGSVGSLERGAATDTLSGGTGDDQLYLGWSSSSDAAAATGGAGADRFVLALYAGTDETSDGVYNFSLHSMSPVSSPDRITDFNAGEGDLLRSGITNGLGGNIPLVWRGTAAAGFTAALGQTVGGADLGDGVLQLWTFFDAANNRTVLFMDRNRDFTVDGNDFMLLFDGNVSLSPASFTAGTFASGPVGTGGTDTLTGTALADQAIGGLGNDSLSGLGGADTIWAGPGNDTLDGGEQADLLLGGDGNDSLRGGSDAGNDTLYGGAGADTLEGQDGNDTLYAAGTGNWSGQSAQDAPGTANVLRGGGNDDQLYGAQGDDQLFGDANNDYLSGGEGADTLDGGLNIDTVSGGGGNDRIVYDAGDATLDGGAGVDVLVVAAGFSLGSLNLASTSDQTSGDTAVVRNFEGVDLSALTTAANVSGDANANMLIGTPQNDSLSGLDGDDTLDGAGGADTLVGGTGNDTFVVDSTADVVVENANEGTDAVNSSVSFTLGATLENLVLLAGASTGTGNTLNNALTGNASANTLTGLAGNDTLDGGAGADTLDGGDGNDTYAVDNAGDVLVDTAGTDTVRSAIDWTLATGFEHLTFTGAGAFSGTGNAEANSLTGSSGNDTLRGLGGNDTLNGEGGNDSLVGGAGNDSMTGGAGDDIYVVEDAGDVVTESFNAGTDTVRSSLASYTLGYAVEHLVLLDGATTGTGNELNNLLTGNSAANTLSGSSGDDTLTGGGGNDSIDGGTGNDTAVFTGAGASYAIGWSAATSTFTVSSTAEGTDTLKNIETLRFSDGDVAASLLQANAAPTGSVNIARAAGATGAITQGETLTASNNLADANGIPTSGAGAIVYQWKADGAAISGATGSTFTLTQAQVGKTITVTASYTDQGGTAESVTSAATTAVANVNDAPTGTITITGTPTQGQTLTAANTLADVDGIPTSGSGAIAYQWSAGGVAISGATGSTLVLTQAQVGKTITVAARYTDIFGTLESVTSSATTAVANVNDAPTGSVTISGSATRGQTLTAANTLADVDGIPTSGSGAISYQWRADGAPISGATSSSFLLTQAQVGKAVSVTASYTDSGGTTESVTSSATAAVTNVNSGPAGAVTITGTPTQGQTLTAANTLADPDGIPTSGAGAIAYQWSAGGVAISGATGSTLNLTQSLVGKALTVRASYTDNFGQAESVISAATSVVANVNDAPTGAVSISGNASQRHSLLATNTLADVDGIPGSGAGAISYQWRANGAPISGATGSTFSPTPTQIGKVITVTASYTDLGGAVESITSPATEPIRGFREFWHDAVTRGMERPNPQALPFGQDLLMADTSYASDLARLFGVPLEFGS